MNNNKYFGTLKTAIYLGDLYAANSRNQSEVAYKIKHNISIKYLILLIKILI